MIRPRPSGTCVLPNGEVQRHLEFTLAGIGVAQDQNSQAVHRKTPDDAESIEVCEEGHIAVADDDGEDLQHDDDVDDAVAGAEATDAADETNRSTRRLPKRG